MPLSRSQYAFIALLLGAELSFAINLAPQTCAEEATKPLADPLPAATLGNQIAPDNAITPLPPANPAEPADPAIPLEVAPELKRIQQDLGGPVINQFPILRHRIDEPAPIAPQAPRALIAVSPAAACESCIAALRDAASELDESANRLERFELYRQADALRAQAQRLREDARKLLQPHHNGVESSVAPAWDPQPASPQPAPQEPRRFGLEIQSYPLTPTEPIKAEPPREPAMGQRPTSDADRG